MMKTLLTAFMALTIYCIPNSAGTCINPWGYPTLAECNQYLADVQKFCGPGNMPVAKPPRIVVLHKHVPVYSGMTIDAAECEPAKTTECIAR